MASLEDMEIPNITVDMHTKRFWSPFHATERIFSASSYGDFPNTAIEDIAKRLPNKYDGFTLGITVKLSFVSEEEVLERPRSFGETKNISTGRQSRNGRDGNN